MSVRGKLRLTVAVACLFGFALLAPVRNPYALDVCASQSYGYPLPVYTSWCECFINDPQPAVNLVNVGLDVFVWSLLGLALSSIFIRLSGRSIYAIE